VLKQLDKPTEGSHKHRKKKFGDDYTLEGGSDGGYDPYEHSAMDSGSDGD